MALSMTVSDVQLGTNIVVQEGGSTQVLNVNDANTLAFTGSGANPSKSVRLEVSVDGTSYSSTPVQTVTANSDGSFSFNTIPLGTPVSQPLYYRARSMTT